MNSGLLRGNDAEELSALGGVYGDRAADWPGVVPLCARPEFISGLQSPINGRGDRQALRLRQMTVSSLGDG